MEGNRTLHTWELAALLTLYLRMPVGGMTYQHVVNIVLVPCVLWLISQITMLAFGDHIVRNIATAISIFSLLLSFGITMRRQLRSTSLFGHFLRASR